MGIENWKRLMNLISSDFSAKSFFFSSEGLGDSSVIRDGKQFEKLLQSLSKFYDDDGKSVLNDKQVDEYVKVTHKFKYKGDDCSYSYTVSRDLFEASKEMYDKHLSSAKIPELEEQIKRAVDKEDYELAAKLKKDIEAIKKADTN